MLKHLREHSSVYLFIRPATVLIRSRSILILCDRKGSGSHTKKAPPIRQGFCVLDCAYRPYSGLLQLGTGFPARHILKHLGREFVDGNTHRAELQAGDLLVDYSRKDVNTRGQLAFLFDEILGRESLVGE